MSDVIPYPHPGARVGLRDSPWDSRAFGRRCYELVAEDGWEVVDPRGLLSFLAGHGAGTVTCRLSTPPGPPAAARALLRAAGFFQADLQLEYVLSLAGREAPPGLPGDLRPAGDGDRETILDIAARAFAAFRFADIPGVTQDMVGRRYRDWCSQILTRHPGLAHVLVHEGELAGFFAAEPKGRPGHLNLTLAAVNPACRGVPGYALFAKALAAYSRAGWRTAGAALSAENLSVLNLYASLEAKFVRAVQFHLWNAPAPAGG
jgi:hypothetical protein